jgi:subtilisin family serine protease
VRRLLPVLSLFFALASAGPAAALTCTDKPADSTGYQVTAVHADQVAAPATTKPIAVLDTGVADVPELGGRIRQGYDVTSGQRLTIDHDGHGTAVASIAAAAGDARGVSITSPVLPIKIFTDGGESTAEDVVAGIERAVAADAGVINISGAGSAADVDAATARAVQTAIEGAVTLGVPVIAAVGNEGASALGVPAAYPHVIAVGATDASGAAASFSNRGSGLDLVAPGENIVTPAPHALCGSGYQVVTGTSFAAPSVAGAAALLLAKHPDLDVSQLTDMLRLRGIRNPAPGWTLEMGFGMLDVAAALSAPIPSADQAEVDDDIGWAKLQPSVLSAPKRSRTVFARIAPHQDPSDVYRLKLKKGDRLKVKLQQPAGTKLKLAFGARSLARKSGTSFTQKIKKAGTYYVGVTIQTSPPAGTGYGLSLKR